MMCRRTWKICTRAAPASAGRCRRPYDLRTFRVLRHGFDDRPYAVANRVVLRAGLFLARNLRLERITAGSRDSAWRAGKSRKSAYDPRQHAPPAGSEHRRLRVVTQGRPRRLADEPEPG